MGAKLSAGQMLADVTNPTSNAYQPVGVIQMAVLMSSLGNIEACAVMIKFSDSFHLLHSFLHR